QAHRVVAGTHRSRPVNRLVRGGIAESESRHKVWRVIAGAQIGTALGCRGLSAVVASPLLRARQTAHPVADRAGLHVVTDPCLTDRDYGQWTGTSRESVIARWGSVDRAPGVEPRSVVAGRAVEGLTGIARRSLGGAVAV